MATASTMTPTLLDEYADWLTAVFLESPMRCDGLESLVCEDERGEVVGFFGIVARQVMLDGKRYRGSVGSNFCVRPAKRGGLGRRVAEAYLASSGDLAFMDRLTDRPRRLWDRVGMVVMPQSI